jgi:putative nucleotidyltransferase with HDIG domain
MGLLAPISVPRPNVLVVDDEPTICDAVADALPAIAAKVAIAANTAEAISTLDSDCFDVVLCDLYMPGGGGLDVLQHASRAQLDLGFILMTGKPQVNDIVAACRLHAADILLKPFSLESLQTAVQKAYARVFHTRRERIHRNQLRSGLRHRVIQLEDTKRQLRDSYRDIIEAMVVILDHREHETCAHSFRVRTYATYLAAEINYPPDQLPTLSTAALLHDIGKVAVPDLILLKPGKLDPAETLLLQQHAVIGEQIVRRSAMLQDCAPIIRHHHERWDGKGYPDGLVGDHTPLGARLFALADTLDAMTSDRCYRAALSLQQVHVEVARCTGQQFDPDLAHVFQSVPDHQWIALRNDADAQAASFNPFIGE